jgi:outer membrane protein assembly complex protein YaeT
VAQTGTRVLAASRIAVLVMLSTVAVPASSRAQEAPPTETAPLVKSLRLTGVEALDEGDLRAILQTKVTPWWPLAPDRRFDRRQFEVDLKRIVAYYRDHGYPRARVLSHDVDVRDDGRAVDLSITIQEGEPLVVRDLAVSGLDPLSPDETAALRERLPVSVGAPIVRQEVLSAGELLANELKDRGYAYATVRPVEERLDSGDVSLRFEVTPGTQAYFGPIDIEGNASVSDHIIRRQLTYRPGELFRRRLLQESQRRLYGLDLFEFATIGVQDAERQPAEVRTRVTVAEGKHRHLRFSAGYGTEDKLRGEAAWQHVNWFGGARTLGVRGKWSSLDRGVQVDFVQPYFYHSRLALALDGHNWYADEPAYMLMTRGGRAAVNGQLGPHTSWSVALTGEETRSEIVAAALEDLSFRDELIALGLDPTTGRQAGLLTSLGASAAHDTIDNALDPRAGHLLSLKLEQAGAWLPGRYNFLGVGAEGRYYHPVRDRTILASRVRVSTLDPFGERSNVPFSRRSFLGGSSSLRGWGRYEVAPLSGSGLPIGGHSLLELSQEVRVRLGRRFGVVAFLDAGNVWADAWNVDLGDLLSDVGAGVRYFTPIGPVRLDAAYQLTPLEGLRIDGAPQTRRWRLHFSIGQAF